MLTTFDSNSDSEHGGNHAASAYNTGVTDTILSEMGKKQFYFALSMVQYMGCAKPGFESTQPMSLDGQII